MKKIIIYLLLPVILYSSNTSTTYAWGVVFDPTMYAKQIAQFMKDTSIALSSGTTAVQQTIDTTNNILKTMKDAMTLVQIVKSGQLVNTLITASTGGDPLLVSNPKLYLQNKGIAVTQGGIDAIAKQNGIYSNSVMNNIVAKAKIDNSSLATNLTAINQSGIPAMQKTKICNDTSLSDMAKSQVSLSGGDYNTVKRNLNASLCVGNPNTDPALAKRLVALSNQRPSLDTFYAITSGDNKYTKAQLSQIATDKAANDAKTTAIKDTSSGIKSQTTCTKFASNGLCIEDTIKQASSVLTKAYTDALGSDLATKISSIGSGAGSIIGTAFNTLSLAKGLATTMQGVTGAGSSGTGNNGKVGTVSIPGSSVAGATGSLPTNSTTNTTYTSSTGYSQDLKNNPQGKDVIASSPKDLLKYHQSILNDLKTADGKYNSTITSYNSQLDTVKACYDNLLTNYKNEIDPNDSRIITANNFYNQKKTENYTLSLGVAGELKKIEITANLISATVSGIDNSNSTDEITAIFKNYQDTVKNQDLPDINSGASSLAKQMEFAGELQISIIEGGEMFNMKETCASISAEIIKQRGIHGAGI